MRPDASTRAVAARRLRGRRGSLSTFRLGKEGGGVVAAGARGGVEGRRRGREVALLAYPLILSHLSFTIQTFVDRLFLTWYSAEAVAGAVTGLFAVWSVVALFTGTGEYLTTFVAQYIGAGRPARVGPALWQGVYFAIGAGLFLALLAPLAGPVFDLAGHDAALRTYEVEYARVLLLGAFPVVLMATLSTFFAGRGETHVILLVNVLATVVNIAFDWLWIFGAAASRRWA